MSSPKTHDTIANVNQQHKLFVGEEQELTRKYPFRYVLQVDRSETQLLYRDGVLYKQLSPGRQSWWAVWPHKWKIQRINMRVEILDIEVEGRVKGPAFQGEAAGAAADLACKVKSVLGITCCIKELEQFLKYRDPISVFLASVSNLVVEEIGVLPYDQYGSWATELRDKVQSRLTRGGSDDSERLIGMEVQKVYVQKFEPNSSHDRNVLAMFQMVERARREMVEAQANQRRDEVVAQSYATQGQILNLPPSILALQDSPVGRELIARDAKLKELLIASGLNPGVSVQPLRDQPTQISGGQPSIGYLNPPTTPLSAAATGYPPPAAPSTPMPPTTMPPAGYTPSAATPTPAYAPASPASSFFTPTNPGGYPSPGPLPASAPVPAPAPTPTPVDPARQQLEIAALEADGYMCAPGNMTPAFDAAGQPIPGTAQWMLQVYQTRQSGTLEIVFQCPAGYPAVPPRVKMRPPMGGSLSEVTPNAVLGWNPARQLVDIARELSSNTPE